MKENIKPATGRLGVLVVGVGGAVATTMITGTLAARKGLAKSYRLNHTKWLLCACRMAKRNLSKT